MLGQKGEGLELPGTQLVTREEGTLMVGEVAHDRMVFLFLTPEVLGPGSISEALSGTQWVSHYQSSDSPFLAKLICHISVSYIKET